MVILNSKVEILINNNSMKKVELQKEIKGVSLQKLKIILGQLEKERFIKLEKDLIQIVK